MKEVKTLSTSIGAKSYCEIKHFVEDRVFELLVVDDVGNETNIPIQKDDCEKLIKLLNEAIELMK